MSNPVIFKSLPATFPEENNHKLPAAAGSVLFHMLLITVVILLPLLMPQRLERWQLMALITPLAPPPSAATEIQSQPPAPAQAPAIQRVIHVDPGTMVAPLEIPKDIAQVMDDPTVIPVVGVPGGVPGGVNSVLSGVLLAGLRTVEPAAPPPPPPPIVAAVPAALITPVRVGGLIQEPKVIKVVPPVYPALAMKARITGKVTLEAILTSDGAVEEIRVIDGHPLLVQAAIDCVKQWQYQPTYLNGEPVPVILTAIVHFDLRTR